MTNTNRTDVRVAPLSRRSGREQGIALVATLLLLTLLSAVTVGMVLAASSDELINGYYRNMRSSFYAADSGLNIVRQAMLNQLAAAVPTTMTNPAVQPIPDGTEASVVSSMLSAYGSNLSLNSGQAASSWPSNYRVSSVSLTLADCLPTGPSAGGTCTTPTGTPTGYSYTYSYSLTAVGQSRATEQTTLTDRGSMRVIVDLTPGGGATTSFAAYGMFIDNWDICNGSYLVPGTVTGPVFTNGAWTFGTSGSYIFTDPVGSANANLGYQFSDGCYQSPNDPYVHGHGRHRQTIDPDFQAGYEVGATPVPLPSNDYSQKKAVLDGMGICASDPCDSDDDPDDGDMNAVLQDAAGNAYPSGGASSGVFLPYSDSAVGSCSTAPCMTGGGILVKGDATVTLTAPDPATNPGQQIVTIVQGGTTTTVTIDLNLDTTTIQSGSDTTVVNGVPTQYDSGGTAVRSATLVYVDGQIDSLKGPGAGGAAIQDGHAMTVVAADDVIITDDITYNTKPVTTTQNQIPGTPPATLIPGNDNGQVLGIYTNTGDIRLENCSGCGNLEIDASLATISDGGHGGVVNTGSHINTLTILGGRIQNDIMNINATTRDVFFDRRFSQNGFAPPWFPATTVTSGGVSSTVVHPSFQRVQWLNQTPF